VVSFTARPLYPREKCPRYQLDRKLGGPQSRSGRYGVFKAFCLIKPGDNFTFYLLQISEIGCVYVDSGLVPTISG
jgi:hypothetical protein